MDIVDRERVEIEAGSAANSGSNGRVAATAHPEEDIDITTDDSATTAAPSVAVSASPPAAVDEGTIEVSDDEIEVADPAQLLSLQPPPPSVGVLRSRPPAPPSSRPRLPSVSSLPPPRHLSDGAGSNRPLGVDPWLLANKTLELAHAHARIAELEEQVAFRDARILELEESLAKARRKLEDVEAKSRPVAMPRSSLLPAGEPEPPVVTETRPALAVPSSADDEAEEEESAGEENDEHGASYGDPTVAATPSGSDGDLQQISGIGPRFEAALRKQGITRLSQIAAWSDADVRQVARALKIPKSRIVKGRWVEVAREVIGTRAASE